MTPAWWIRRLWRRLTVTCWWCDQHDRFRDPVTVHRQDGSWWHADCWRIADSRYQCSCPPQVGVWEYELDGIPYGRCAHCSRIRRPMTAADIASPLLLTLQLLQSVAYGSRGANVITQVDRIWSGYRAAGRR